MCGIGVNIAKYPLILVNIVSLVIGLVILGLAISFHLSSHKANVVGLILSYVTGAVIAGTAIWGIFAAFRGNICCIKIFGGVLTLIIIWLLVAGIMDLVMSYKINHNDVSSAVNKRFTEAAEGDADAQREVDKTHENFECCGPDGPGFWEQHSRTIPESCCWRSPCTPEKVWKRGCTEPIEEALKWWVRISGILCLLFAAVEIVAVVFACCV